MLDGFWWAHVGWYIGTRNPVICFLYSIAGPLRVLYDYAWFAGFGVAFGLYAALMRGTPLVDLSGVPPAGTAD